MKVRFAALFCASVLLAACRQDPATQRDEQMKAAQAYEKAGKLPEAIVSYRAALQLDPDVRRRRGH